LADQGVVDDVEWFDDERTVRAVVFWISPQTHEGFVCDVGGVHLGFVGESFTQDVVGTTEEVSDVARGGLELGTELDLSSHPVVELGHAIA
jgi:hypothetical protein